jgi:hypothetical protein
MQRHRHKQSEQELGGRGIHEQHQKRWVRQRSIMGDKRPFLIPKNISPQARG